MRLDPFYDDATKQLSLSRIISASIIVYCFIAFYGKDIPTNWMYAALGFYLGNKSASTLTEIKNGKPAA